MADGFRTKVLVEAMVSKPAHTQGVLTTAVLTAGRVHAHLAVLAHLAGDGPFEMGSPRAQEIEAYFTKLLAGLLAITKTLERLGETK